MEMKVMYTCDNSYIWLMGISMISLFENNKDSDEITIYLIGKEISLESKAELKELCIKYNRQIEFYDIQSLPIPKYLERNGRWPIICYARLFAYELLKDVNRILYLDCDTIVLENLSDLFTAKYNEYPVYGCKDFIGNLYKKLIGMPKDAVNVNGGVLLFNLQKMRDINSTKLITLFLDKYGKYISYADQDILNGTFWKNMGILDASYDLMSIMKVFSYKEIIQLKHPLACCSKKEIDSVLASPKIIHYTGNYRTIRPWFKNSDHPYKDIFENYKVLSPWKDKELMDEKASGEILVANKIRVLPCWISCNVLGFMYGVLRPMKILIKGKMRRTN